MRTLLGCRTENFALRGVFSKDLTVIQRVQKNPIPMFKHKSRKKFLVFLADAT